ncbi:trans-1,2-dihydrobenzene-1,2-diol dehydrogenase [Diachasma alloeum]|uniref:trans-1,2-dihydrobenzene-1,2-diol dehydrogenase n=1 Tax=Diachasma alloeum TaxID=454923 RepID=UPI000738487D|nr:trans-1,2-dihydrobenzene-1,2-diol dehydrogenase [Diachasma alloeum]XP_015110718.1 trans-1,2-dihydrobenzene-1,2-diol dehydrogenase [Diachasma alloeum]XP_015110719.1 trans-1,2-dihydrobenzene-1,2-diol dehydrogenase [Diachasma alloeum]
MATRWGIASAGKIAHDFTTALATLPNSEHQVVAIAARDVTRAEKFAQLHNIPKYYGNYEQLAKDSNVEIVYIGVQNPQHLEVTKLMLENGKHVLCEKPLTLNVKQSTDLINFAKQKELFLMEAIWSRCFPLYQRVKKEIETGTIGDVKQVIVSFGFRMPDVERLSNKAQGGGTILDLGVYTVQFSQFIYDGEHPVSIKASGFLNNDGVDQSMSATLLYSNNRTATIVTHALVGLPNEAHVIGTKGTIKIPQFWCPVKIELPSGTIEHPLPEAPHEFNFVNSAGLRFEAMEARECIKAGLKESTKISHAESLRIAEIEDELRRQIGVVYPQD